MQRSGTSRATVVANWKRPMMDSRMENTSRLKKLVTLCTTYNQNSGSVAEYCYKGNSKSEKQSVEVSFPAYKENLMFYEHFANQDDIHPNRLAFMYLGGDSQGKIHHNFWRYTYVVRIDIFKQFKSVNAVFHTVSQLPHCKEVRFFLSNENMVAAPEEKRMLDRLRATTTDVYSYMTTSVTALSIYQDGKTDVKSLPNGNELSRLELILSYALQLFPSLESFYVKGLNADGQMYCSLTTFLITKGLVKHNVSIQAGKIFCSPAPAPPVPVQQTGSANLSLSNPSACSMNPHGRGESFFPTTIASIRNSTLTSTLDPLSVKRIKLEKDNISVPAPPNPPNNQDEDVIILPAPVKKKPQIIDLSDEEGESGTDKGSSGLDTAERQIIISSSVQLASTPASTSCLQLPLPASNVDSVRYDSLRCIGSAYNDWESDSDNEEAKSSPPRPNAAPLPANKALSIEKYVSEEFRMLSNVKKETNSTTDNVVNCAKDKRHGRRRTLQQLEGVHFERRTRR